MTLIYGSFLALYVVALIGLALFGIHKYSLIFLHRRHSADVAPKPDDPEVWPDVLVQLPIFNEKYVVKRLLKAAIRLDYPKEKLHIQLLDDSTDNTARLARKLVSVLQKKGFRIDHIHRTSRTGFKAGALENGVARASAEFIAVFDADFVPQPDFLRQTIPHLTADKSLGMVQTRWGHLNRDYSLLTKLQAIFLDAHFLIEHVVRNRTGKFFNFNGTAGVWRRQAIIDAGGWQHDTLTEDLDLSYRAQLAGWRFLFLPDVVAPAELPVDMNAFKSQQHRWAKGSAQTALKLLPHIIKSDLPFKIRLEAFVHLTGNFAYLLMSIPAVLLIPMLNIEMVHAIKWAVVPYILMFFAATVSVIFYYGYTIKLQFGKLWPHILYLPAVMALGIGLSVNNGKAVLEALLGKQTDFLRTPKFRIETRKDNWKKKVYQSRKSRLPIVEMLLAIYFTLGMGYFIYWDLFLSIPFFLLFQFGFYYISISSFRRLLK